MFFFHKNQSFFSYRLLGFPRFVTAPEDVEIDKENSPVFFKCTAKGYKKPQISWEHNG